MSPKKKNITVTHLKAKDFHKLYNLYHPKIEYPLYERILLFYFKTYFSELYYLYEPKYFFLSGVLAIGQWKRRFKSRKGTLTDYPTLAWVWSERPQLSYLFNIKLKKKMQPTYDLHKLEKKFAKYANWEKMPNFKEVINTKDSRDQMYKT